jgi:hypothetical protein
METKRRSVFGVAKSEGRALTLSLNCKSKPLGRTLYPTGYLVDESAAGLENATVYSLVEVQAMMLKLTSIVCSLRFPLFAVGVCLAAMSGVDGCNDYAAQPIPSASADLGMSS